MLSHLRPLLFAAPLLLGPLAGCGPSKMFTNDDIPKIEKFEDVMWAQAQAADPAFKRTSKSPLADEDYAAVTAAGERLKLTAPRLKEKAFSKGAEFDAFADQLAAHADELIAAASAKDVDKTHAALQATKDTCRACHKKFK